jgi:hypothetical protein
LPRGCQRDVEFAKAALGIAYAKDFQRAFEVAERIDGESLRDGVRQFLYYDLSVEAAARGDAVSLDDAQKHAERVAAPEQRALLYIKIAKAALRHQDRQLAARHLDKAMRLAESVPEPSSQAGVILAAAAGFADFDSYAGMQALKEAVKVVNGTRSQEVEDFHIMRRVSLACGGGEGPWHGKPVRAERYSLFGTLAAMAGTDPDGMLSLARELDDPPTRIRSLISIASAMSEAADRRPPMPAPLK